MLFVGMMEQDFQDIHHVLRTWYENHNIARDYCTFILFILLKQQWNKLCFLTELFQCCGYGDTACWRGENFSGSQTTVMVCFLLWLHVATHQARFYNSWIAVTPRRIIFQTYDWSSKFMFSCTIKKSSTWVCTTSYVDSGHPGWLDASSVIIS